MNNNAIYIYGAMNNFESPDGLSNFLSLPGEAEKKYREAREHYEIVVSRTKESNLSTEALGQMKKAKENYDAVIRTFEQTLDQTGMTELQKNILKKRYESEKPVPFSVVAYLLGISECDTVQYQCSRGHKLLATHLYAGEQINEIL